MASELVSDGLNWDSLSGLQNIEFLIGDSPEDLKNQLRSLKTPTKLYGVYMIGSTHIAWILPAQKIKKIIKKKNRRK